MLEHEPEQQPPTVNAPPAATPSLVATPSPAVNTPPAVEMPPATDARVTPQELTAALASLDAEREGDARRLADTITIGEAVQELHLEAAPEDIWRHVQAQRARRAPVTPSVLPPMSVLPTMMPPAASPQSGTSWKTTALAGTVFGIALIGGLSHSGLLHTDSRAAVAGKSIHLVLPVKDALAITGDNTTASYRCNGSVVSITSDNSRIILHGRCASVVVTGDHDTVIVDATPSIEVTGDNDTVQWRSASPPAVVNTGSNNTLSSK